MCLEDVIAIQEGHFAISIGLIHTSDPIRRVGTKAFVYFVFHWHFVRDSLVRLCTVCAV